MNTGETLRRLAAPKGKAVLGFDSFVDRIGRYPGTMASFGERLRAQNGRSFMAELTDIRERLGGNAPNTANGLTALGAEVTCVGAFGVDRPHAAFRELDKQCDLISFGNPAHCMAVEYDKGKLFFIDQGDYKHLSWQTLVSRVGLERLRGRYKDAALIGLFNWGELPAMQGVWEHLTQDILARLSRRPVILTDPSDMGNRQDVPSMIALLRRMSHAARVVMSVNQSEANKLCEVFNITASPLLHQAEALYAQDFCELLVVHAGDSAIAVSPDGSCSLPTRRVNHPVLLTGAGDTFNAGFALGLMLGFDPGGCLRTANASSACYVRTGSPPSVDALAEEIKASAGIWE